MSDKVLTLQVYMGLAWILGCIIFGLLIVKNGAECHIARQYLCQTATFMCSLCLLALTTVQGNYHAYVMFVWFYGKFQSILISQVPQIFFLIQASSAVATNTP
jgi:hypothetical protein